MFSREYCALVLIIIGLSCSGSIPLFPEQITEAQIDYHSNRTCVGIWDVYIDSQTELISVVTVRSAEFTLNVVKFLQPPSAPINLVSFTFAPGTNLIEGKIVADVTFQHPFPGTKFCGHDVLGIIMDDQPKVQLQSDPDIYYTKFSHALLRNPDGWTRWWNENEFTSYGKIFGYTDGILAKDEFIGTGTINAFKYFDDYTAKDAPFDPPVPGRGFFSSSSPGANTRRYYLQFLPVPSPVYHFKYAVSASFEPPDTGMEPPWSPADFNQYANQPEAYKIDLIDNKSSAWWVNESNKGGDLDFTLEIRDWQLGSIESQISSIIIESPTLFPEPINIDISTGVPVPGYSTAATFPVHVENVNPSGLDYQIVIVTVVSAEKTTYAPPIPGFNYPDAPLAA